VVEIGEGEVYEEITKVGIEHLEKVLEKFNKRSNERVYE
jgi:glutaredoxin 3